jgi:hypothetical protein
MGGRLGYTTREYHICCPHQGRVAPLGLLILSSSECPGNCPAVPAKAGLCIATKLICGSGKYQSSDPKGYVDNRITESAFEAWEYLVAEN